MRTHRFHPAARLALLTLVGSATLLLASVAPSRALTSPAAAATVRFPAGWNLVAAPTGSVLAQATPPFYAFGASGSDYISVGQGELIGGRAVWMFFAADTTVTLGRTAAAFSRTLSPGGRWVLVGNPSTTASLPVSGGDAVFAYDPARGYVSVDDLRPGQGAWVFRADAGEVTLGRSPSGTQAAELRRLQAAVQQDPTDRTTLTSLARVAGELLQARQYTQVQTALDDLRAAAEDGLRSQGAGPLPTMSRVQVDAAAGVRERLADAAEATAAGAPAQADQALAAALTLAQSAEDDAVARARAQRPSAALLYTARRQPSSDALAAFGALLRTAFFASALGTPPSDPFWNVATAVLTASPLPAAAGPTPTSAAAGAAPSIERLGCSPLTLLTGDTVSCAPVVRGTVSGVSWSAPNGNPASGAGVTFATSYSTTGTQTITLQACNGSACVSQAQAVEVLRRAEPTPAVATPAAPIVLTGSISVTEQDVGSCGYSVMPLTSGTMNLTVTVGASATDPVVATGNLHGGGSGSRRVTCNGVSGTVSWAVDYGGSFGGGIVAPSTGAVTMTGTITGKQQVSYSNCSDATGHAMTCPPVSQPSGWTYPVHVSGAIATPSGMGTGTLVFDSGCSTSGSWTTHR